MSPITNVGLPINGLRGGDSIFISGGGGKWTIVPVNASRRS